MCEPEEENGFPTIQVVLDHQGEERVIEVEAVLFAVGRVPNVEGMGFEEAGIQYDLNKGIKVNKNLLTTNKQVYAAGDCCSNKQFTHNSDMHARIVLYNALLMQS